MSESLCNNKLFLGLQNIGILIEKNMLVFLFATKMVNGKYMRLNQSTAYQEEVRYQTAKLSLFLMRREQEGQT